MRKICALMALCAVAASECMAKGIEIDTAPANVVLDLDRYMGRWYEIARFDHPFERNLEYCKAYYTRKSNGDIEVKNVGMNTAKGRIKESYGNAKISKTQGQLRVSFFLFFYSDYNILAIDDDYK
ncbi:MAG: lipocalin family protein [Alistipes sp.]|nr:lipocalin family protein [Alistipes sp.]